MLKRQYAEYRKLTLSPGHCFQKPSYVSLYKSKGVVMNLSVEESVGLVPLNFDGFLAADNITDEQVVVMLNFASL